MYKRQGRIRGPVVALAVGLVLFTVVGAGYFIHWLLPSIALPVAFALAAVLSPTDAVAVSAITQDRLPTPLMHMLQGESLYPLYAIQTDTANPPVYLGLSKRETVHLSAA